MGGHQVSSPSRSLVLSLLVIVHQGKTDLGQDDGHENEPHDHAEAPNGDRDPANLGGAENEREARPQKGLALEPQVLDVVSKRLCSGGGGGEEGFCWCEGLSAERTPNKTK